jgi:hypothetical protein
MLFSTNFFKPSVNSSMRMMVMAGTTLFGFGFHHFMDLILVSEQYQVWICVYPVVLFMAPFGAFILSRINIEWIIKRLCVSAPVHLFTVLCKDRRTRGWD